MKPSLLAACAALSLAVSGAALAQDQGSAPVSQDAGTRSAESAAETPLRNANLVKQKIPPVLTDAMANPYLAPRPMTCGVIAADVAALDEALGPDFDANAAAGKPGFVPSAMKVAANTFIPFQGLLRYVSGADAHDRLVIRAIIAGSARRSYLKGLGEARRCAAPAAPIRPVTRRSPRRSRR